MMVGTLTPSEYLELGTTLGTKYRHRPRRHKPHDPHITNDINNGGAASDGSDHVTSDDVDVVDKTVASRRRLLTILLSSIVVVFVVVLVAVLVVIIVLGMFITDRLLASSVCLSVCRLCRSISSSDCRRDRIVGAFIFHFHLYFLTH